MVQVGHMRVRMHQLLVSVTVLVPPRDHRLMDVVVVAVGMFVFVIVFVFEVVFVGHALSDAVRRFSRVRR